MRRRAARTSERIAPQGDTWRRFAARDAAGRHMAGASRRSAWQDDNGRAPGVGKRRATSWRHQRGSAPSSCAKRSEVAGSISVAASPCAWILRLRAQDDTWWALRAARRHRSTRGGAARRRATRGGGHAAGRHVAGGTPQDDTWRGDTPQGDTWRVLRGAARGRTTTGKRRATSWRHQRGSAPSSCAKRSEVAGSTSVAASPCAWILRLRAG